MKIKLSEQELMYLEDVLLGNYYAMPLEQLEGSAKLRVLLDRVQDRLYGEQLFGEDF